MRKFSAKIGVTALFALALFAFSISQASADDVEVECDDGDSIQAALDQAENGDTINVSGTCNERVTIILDNLTLDGGGTAVIDGTGVGGRGGLLRVRASNVRIRDITVQKSPGHGIQIQRSGSAVIQGTTAQLNATDGIAIRNSGSAVIENTIAQDNTRFGISVFQSAFARIGASSGNHDNPGTPGSEGNIISDNDRHGVLVGGSSSAHIFHNNILDNAGSGILLSTGGSALIDGNNITVNTERGISLSTNASVQLSRHPRHGGRAGFSEPNLIEENDQGVRCRLGGALTGEPQNFGTGNPGAAAGAGAHDDDTDISGSCPEASSLAFP